jgi:hypothetical protein
MYNSEKVSSDSVTRRNAIWKYLIITGSVLLLLGVLSLFAPSKKAEAGFGRCSISGCPCGAYRQTYGTDLCSNCGHQYAAHW